MAMDQGDCEPYEERATEGDEVPPGDGLVLQSDEVAEGESTEYIPLLDLLSQYVNFKPLLASMRDRYEKLSQEQLYVRDADMRLSIQDQMNRVGLEIEKFEKRGEQVLKRLGGIKFTYSAGEVSCLEAVLKAESIKADATKLEQLATSIRNARGLLSVGCDEIARLIDVETHRKELQLTELTTLLIGTTIRAVDYEDIQLLWQPTHVGTTIRLNWDILNRCWGIPAHIKPIKTFKRFIEEMSSLHRPNGQDGDTLFVEGTPLAEGKWNFQAKIDTAAQWGTINCSNSTSTQS